MNTYPQGSTLTDDTVSHVEDQAPLNVSAQTLAVLFSALLVETGVMDENHNNAKLLGLALAAVVSGTMISAFAMITIKWRALRRQGTQVE